METFYLRRDSGLMRNNTENSLFWWEIISWSAHLNPIGYLLERTDRIWEYATRKLAKTKIERGCSPPEISVQTLTMFFIFNYRNLISQTTSYQNRVVYRMVLLQARPLSSRLESPSFSLRCNDCFVERSLIAFIQLVRRQRFNR